jgi:hypothetical protein
MGKRADFEQYNGSFGIKHKNLIIKHCYHVDKISGLFLQVGNHKTASCARKVSKHCQPLHCGRFVDELELINSGVSL